jgi:hypothetical protein
MNITANGILYKVEIQIKPTGSTHNTFAHLYRLNQAKINLSANPIKYKYKKELIAGTSFNDKTAATEIPIWAQNVVNKLTSRNHPTATA